MSGSNGKQANTLIGSGIQGREHDVAIEVDLEDLMGQPVNDRQLQVEIGLALTDKIEERLNNEGPCGRTTYSQDYQDSVEFAVFNKTNRANLRLTGEMIDNIGVINNSEDRLTIGYSTELNSAKAFNHHTGDTVPRRAFMFLTPTELREVREQFSARLPAQQNETQTPDRQRLDEFFNFLTTLSAQGL